MEPDMELFHHLIILNFNIASGLLIIYESHVKVVYFW